MLQSSGKSNGIDGKHSSSSIRFLNWKRERKRYVSSCQKTFRNESCSRDRDRCEQSCITYLSPMVATGVVSFFKAKVLFSLQKRKSEINTSDRKRMIVVMMFSR